MVVWLDDLRSQFAGLSDVDNKSPLPERLDRQISISKSLRISIDAIFTAWQKDRQIGAGTIA